MRRLVGVVPHAFADDGDGNVHVTGNACSVMSGDISGERHLQAYHAADSLQRTVYVLLHTLILAVFRPVSLTDDG